MNVNPLVLSPLNIKQYSRSSFWASAGNASEEKVRLLVCVERVSSIWNKKKKTKTSSTLFAILEATQSNSRTLVGDESVWEDDVDFCNLKLITA